MRGERKVEEPQSVRSSPALPLAGPGRVVQRPLPLIPDGREVFLPR